MNWKVDAIIDLQDVIACSWPYIDLSVSAKLLTVLITICHWSFSLSYHTYTQNIITLSAHIPLNCWDLTLCLSGLSWIYQSAEAKLSQLLSGIWSTKEDEVTSKLCYIRYLHFYHFVQEEKLNRSKCMTWKFTNNLIGQSRAVCVRPTCEVWLNANPYRNDDRACKSWKNLQIEPILSGVLSLTTAMHPGSNKDPVQVAHNWIKLHHLENVAEQTVHMFPTDNMTEEVRARSC